MFEMIYIENLRKTILVVRAAIIIIIMIIITVSMTKTTNSM